MELALRIAILPKGCQDLSDRKDVRTGIGDQQCIPAGIRKCGKLLLHHSRWLQPALVVNGRQATL